MHFDPAACGTFRFFGLRIGVGFLFENLLLQIYSFIILDLDMSGWGLVLMCLVLRILTKMDNLVIFRLFGLRYFGVVLVAITFALDKYSDFVSSWYLLWSFLYFLLDNILDVCSGTVFN